MTKEIWLNLPVKNLEKSRSFFTAMGYRFDSGRDNEQMAALIIGEKKFPVMLIDEKTFGTFAQIGVADARKTCEILISLSAESREEVDDMAQKAAGAGGTVFAQPAENQGWMYGCAFADPDGHRWNVLYMDPDKMPQ